MFKSSLCRWGYEPVGPATSGEKFVLQAIDAFVDAILTPKEEGEKPDSGFVGKVKFFLRENNLPLNPRTKPGAPPDPFLEKLRALKGMEVSWPKQ